MMKRRLLLINPYDVRRPGISVDRGGRFQPLALGIIAALTPEDWEVEILDEKWDGFSFRPADLVGITAFTSTAARGYELAGIYREKGVPVVMGGIHPGMCPEEALKFSDAVVVGEVELIWKKVIEDFEKGEMQGIYKGGLVAPEEIPLPRRELFHPKIIPASIQTARGCPMHCDFCSVHVFNGRQHRMRPVDHVLEELAQVKQKFFFFTDDNLIGHSPQSMRRTIELFKGMAENKLNKWWFCQASLNFGDNEELLYWARRSGCKLVFLGIEALEVEGLKEVKKHLNLKRVEQYRDTFRKIHKAGIPVLGSFVFGMDSDTEERLQYREEFIVNGELDVIQATVLTPLPGTGFYKRLQKENRLIHTNYPDDWHYYDYNKVVHRPRRMSPEALERAMTRCHLRMSSIPVITKKFLRSLWNTRSLTSSLVALQFNRIARKIAGVLYR